MRIGIVGTGKDTVAQMLSELSGLPTVALAKPLHDAATHIWGKSCLERDQYESCIISDVRFENEAATV